MPDLNSVPALKVLGLTKRFGNFMAVDGVSFEVQRGEVIGYLGPNGSGKTTTIRMLATLLRPTAGSAFIAGYEITKEPEKVRAVIGYMPDSFGVYDDIKVWEYLDFFAAAYRLPRAERPGVIDHGLH